MLAVVFRRFTYCTQDNKPTSKQSKTTSSSLYKQQSQQPGKPKDGTYVCMNTIPCVVKMLASMPADSVQNQTLL
jgi:hypothetical protein